MQITVAASEGKQEVRVGKVQEKKGREKTRQLCRSGPLLLLEWEAVKGRGRKRTGHGTLKNRARHFCWNGGKEEEKSKPKAREPDWTHHLARETFFFIHSKGIKKFLPALIFPKQKYTHT